MRTLVDSLSESNEIEVRALYARKGGGGEGGSFVIKDGAEIRDSKRVMAYQSECFF